ncbi:MAG: ATP-binding cassette domain-containing protein, partial [Sphaerochaeta sp.]
MDNRVVKVKIQNVKKTYNSSKGDVVALNGVSLDIKENEFVSVVGPSGCGKSTLLNIVAGLFPPSSGTITVNDKIVEGTSVER